MSRLLDPRFKYTPALHTDVASTLRKFGFKPTTDAERRARQERKTAEVVNIGAAKTRRKS